LLLSTTGRKSGLRRVTPLQYEEVEGVFYIGSSRGLKADWVRNILANPQVEIQVKSRHFQGLAEVITDLELITDFLELRLRRHPKMIALMLRAEGFPKDFDRSHLEKYVSKLALISIKPLEGE
jgi:deazaflavin-dependent oxidoreductase (nitroreductase family)